MSLFYKVVVFIHIFSAIMGMGPGFILTTVVKSGKTMTELRHSYAIRHKLHIYVMIGGTLLLITGLTMGAMNPYLFHMGWYLTSLILFLISLALGPLALSPRSRPIKALLQSHQGEEIPKEYTQLSKDFSDVNTLKISFYHHYYLNDFETFLIKQHVRPMNMLFFTVYFYLLGQASITNPFPLHKL